MRGTTYFRLWGFSINEGEYPNIHMSWRNRHFIVYVALSGRRKWSFTYIPKETHLK